MDTSNYYTQRQDKLVRNHKKIMSLGQGLLTERYGRDMAVKITHDALEAFRALFPQIPFIGGGKNPLTDTLIQISTMLCLYRALKSRGRPVEEAGELARLMSRKWIAQQPRPFMNLIGKLYMTKFWRKRTKRNAAISQKREYPMNFVYEVVEGGREYEWGVNYLECAIVKFFKQQGAEEFTPYMCEIDNLMFPAMGVKLIRTGTIAQGCTHCDFRFASK